MTTTQKKSPLRLPPVKRFVWGHEEWIADQEHYTAKLLEVPRGSVLGLRFHMQAAETLYLLSGRGLLKFRENQEGESPYSSPTPSQDETFEWKAGHSLVVPPKALYRFEALEKCVLVQVAAPSIADVVELETFRDHDHHGETSGGRGDRRHRAQRRPALARGRARPTPPAGRAGRAAFPGRTDPGQCPALLQWGGRRAEGHLRDTGRFGGRGEPSLGHPLHLHPDDPPA